jgi:hypothetical protein
VVDAVFRQNGVIRVGKVLTVGLGGIGLERLDL